MKSIELNIEKALGTVSKSDVFALEDKAFRFVFQCEYIAFGYSA